MSKLDLSNVTLVSISSNRIPQTIKAIEHCLQLCTFNNVVLFSDCDSVYTQKIEKIHSNKNATITQDYNNFLVHSFTTNISEFSDYVLIIHWDGFIVNTKAWDDSFFEYDYIGAPWPWTDYCGNGGFCLRSKNFLRSQTRIINDIAKKEQLTGPEDVILSYTLRDKFVEMGCSYAPKDIAYKFSTEYGSYDDHQSFGFHNLNLHPQFRYIVEEVKE